MSVHCWGWISHEGARVLHRIKGHLDDQQHQHILQNEIAPPVWMLHTNNIIHLQEAHSSIHNSRVAQEWLSQRADVELDWPQGATDINPIENM